MPGERLLITGASGFLGSHLARCMRGAGHELGLLLRGSSKLDRLAGLEPTVIRFGTVREVAGAVEAYRPSVVLHAACSYGRVGEGLAAMVEANHHFGAAVLEGAAKAGARSFINIGTPLPAEQNLYAFTKAQFSTFARFAPRGGMRFVDVELQTLYGPGDDVTKFTSRLVDDALSGVAVIRMTPGGQRRDFIFIDDAVAALAVLIGHHEALGDGERIGLGSGEMHTLLEFATAVIEAAGTGTRLQGDLPYRLNEPMAMQADISRLRGLGWAPRIGMKEGIARMVEAHGATGRRSASGTG